MRAWFYFVVKLLPLIIVSFFLVKAIDMFVPIGASTDNELITLSPPKEKTRLIDIVESLHNAYNERDLSSLRSIESELFRYIPHDREVDAYEKALIDAASRRSQSGIGDPTRPYLYSKSGFNKDSLRDLASLYLNQDMPYRALNILEDLDRTDKDDNLIKTLGAVIKLTSNEHVCPKSWHLISTCLEVTN